MLLVSLRFASVSFTVSVSFFSPKIASDFFHVLMLPPHSSGSPSSLLPGTTSTQTRHSRLPHTHTHTLNVCVSWRGKLAKRLPAVCLPTSPSAASRLLLPCLLLLLLAPPFIEPRWQLVDFLCGNSHAKTKPISPFICGRQLRRCRSAFLFSALSLSPFLFLSLFVLCARFFFASFSFSHFYAELGCLQLGKEINNRLLDFS